MSDRIAVIGAGQMGNGIAHVFAQSGFPVTIIDVSSAALDKGVATIGKNLDRQVKKGTIDADAQAATLARISTATELAGAADCTVIIEAATLLKSEDKIKFVILGDGSMRAWMLNEVAVRNLTNVSLPGKFPTETMPGFMRAASALLVTLTDHEIFAQTVPNKVQAYMAVGRPIIACLRGEGARLVVEADAGLAVPAEDAAALATAVLTLRDMPAPVREKMGENGRRYFRQNFDQEALTLQLINHLSVLTKNGGSL